MSHFQTRVKNFFAIRENFLPRRPCGHGQFVGANGFMRLFDPTVKHFPAKNFAFLPAAGGLSYQHTGKTQKNVGNFACRHAFCACESHGNDLYDGSRENPMILIAVFLKNAFS